MTEPQAAVERVRAELARIRSITPTWHPVADLIEAALDGTEQPSPRLLDCGFCFEEQGEEVHPHPECTINSPASSALRDYLAAVLREHYLCTNRDEADADGNMPCRCGDWREPGSEADDENDWDSHLADVVLAALLTRTGIVTALADMSRAVTSKDGPS